MRLGAESNSTRVLRSSPSLLCTSSVPTTTRLDAGARGAEPAADL